MDADALDRFFVPLGYMFTAAKETQNQLDRYLASGFNLIDVLWPDENRISYVLAQLLSPTSGHGQGGALLDSFLAQLNDSGVKVENPGKYVRIETEHLTDTGRRIDLLVEWEKFVLAVEHKMGAADQKNQLHDYTQYLETQFQKKFCLVYLNAYSTEVSETTLSKGRRDQLQQEERLKVLNHNPFLVNWAEAAAKVCEAEKMRWFLRDLAQWCRRFEEQEVKDET